MIKSKWISSICILVLMAISFTGCMDAYDYELENAQYETVYDTTEYEETDADLTKGNKGNADDSLDYEFRSDGLLESHYEKHGIEMGFSSPEEYAAAANKVIKNQNVLHKTEAEDGDDVYYLEETNEFVVVSTDGYIRTFFYPNDGIDYFNRQ